MKKQYMNPSLEAVEAEQEQMLALSLPKVDPETDVPGGDALSKEDKGWNIFD